MMYAHIEQQPYESLYEQYLKAQGYQLNQFFREQIHNLYPTATTYPEFFNSNLVNAKRVILKLAGSVHDNLRVFAVQLFRLCFELDIHNSQEYVDKFKSTVFHPNFAILFTKDTQNERDLYNDFQFKKILADLLFLLEHEQCPNVLLVFNRFPILDNILVHLLRSVLVAKGINEQFESLIPTHSVFTLLCQQFGLNVTQYGLCYKFEESDVFCYQQRVDQLFVSYVDDEGTAKSSSYHHSQNTDELLGTNHKISISNLNKTTHSMLNHRRNPSFTLQSPCYRPYLSSTQYKAQRLTQNYRPYQSTIYPAGLPTITQTWTEEHKSPTITRSPSNIANELSSQPYKLSSGKLTDDLGDFYKDFTNTFVLDQVVLEPYKSNIRRIKNNMRGVRRPVQNSYMVTDFLSNNRFD